ncbi:hypothetical protein Niako_0378 [Niastella koreensis GR20-10]|uniref:Uncharacterized protein n=1 Tax=Niastella koreensis (strain DSM 17620 / KACC 11465 / NBRC 106392 / GR20-10) TaxID=700598 RepID=G8TQP2_NIAKG|nr:hypothetical protein Niako_0378 [Niastella koreensis GR20-10]
MGIKKPTLTGREILLITLLYDSALLVFTDTGLLYVFLFSVCIGRWICKCSKIVYIYNCGVNM